jgi:hypothetical protein
MSAANLSGATICAKAAGTSVAAIGAQRDNARSMPDTTVASSDGTRRVLSRLRFPMQ